MKTYTPGQAQRQTAAAQELLTAIMAAVERQRQEKIQAQVKLAQRVNNYQDMQAVIVSCESPEKDREEYFSFHFEKRGTVTVGDVLDRGYGVKARVEMVL